MTAAFALAMTLLIAAMGVFVYERQATNLDEIVDTSLRSRSDDLAALVRSSQTSRSVVGGPRLVESDEGFIQILTSNGRLLDGTTKNRAPALRPDEARTAAREPLWLERHVAGVDGPARILARPASSQGRTLVVVTGASLADRDDTLTTLARSFLIGGPLAVLLASGIGYVLATIGFRPVEAMRQRAKRISLTREGERLPLPDAHDEIRRLGETLNEMLADDLLLIARSADGQLPIRPEDMEIRELLERTRQRFVDRAREQRREIAIDVPDGLTAALDPLRSRQAIGNLVDNALRHGAGDIRLTARGNGTMLEVDVSDQGGGFPAKLEPHAFERFTRADGARTRGGTGIGLAIVRAIAEAHGGTAVIVETQSNGATVRLRMPIAARSTQ